MKRSIISAFLVGAVAVSAIVASDAEAYGRRVTGSFGVVTSSGSFSIFDNILQSNTNNLKVIYPIPIDATATTLSANLRVNASSAQGVQAAIEVFDSTGALTGSTSPPVVSGGASLTGQNLSLSGLLVPSGGSALITTLVDNTAQIVHVDITQ